MNGTPFFVINATNVKSAALWRFSRRYMGDYRVGLVSSPTTRLDAAVAALNADREGAARAPRVRTGWLARETPATCR